MNWHDFLTLAESLMESEPESEASLRSATSRAYYAAFNDARKYLEDYEHFVPSRNADKHRLVPEVLKGLRVHGRLHHEVSTQLGRMRPVRNTADYDDTLHVRSAAERVIGQSRRVFRALDELRRKRGGSA